MNKRMKLRYITELDGVRAIAALMVMFFHFFQNLKVDGDWILLIKKVSFFGQTGVSLFFVLSGFLITRILIVSKGAPNYFLNFYTRRSLRIFPLYYFYLLLVFIILPLLNNTSIPIFSKQIYHWVYLQDFAITFNWDYVGPLHFWSLAVEEHFYLFFPLLVYFLKERQLIVAIIAILFISIVTRFFLNKEGYEVFYFTFTRMDELAIGAILAILELKQKISEEKSKQFIYLFVLISIPTIIIWAVYSKEANSILQVFKFLLISLSYFSLIGFVVSSRKNHFVKKIFTLKPLLYTGRISYGLYVYHGICFYYFDKICPTDNLLIRFFGGFGLAYVVSTISFFCFESLFLKLKNYFDYNKKVIAEAS